MGILSFIGGALMGIVNTLFNVLTSGFRGAVSLIQQAADGIMQYHKNYDFLNIYM